MILHYMIAQLNPINNTNTAFKVYKKSNLYNRTK